MNNKNIIKPSAETLVVGARVKLRNGQTRTVTDVGHNDRFPVKCDNGSTYTYAGLYWGDEDDPKPLDITGVYQKVDVSAFKIGDTIKFKSGVTAKITLIKKEKYGYHKIQIMSSEGYNRSWTFNNDGTTARWLGIESLLDIIEHFPKTTEATTLATNAVAYPLHYTEHPRGLGCIQITQHMSFNLGNVVESVWLSSLKETTALDAIEHLKIAYWFLKQEIERLEKQ